MEIATIPAKDLRHTRAAQEWIAEGRHGRRSSRPLKAKPTSPFACSTAVAALSDATTARIQALPLEQLEALAEALLDFSGPADLAAWLEEHGG